MAKLFMLQTFQHPQDEEAEFSIGLVSLVIQQCSEAAANRLTPGQIRPTQTVTHCDLGVTRPFHLQIQHDGDHIISTIIRGTLTFAAVRWRCEIAMWYQSMACCCVTLRDESVQHNIGKATEHQRLLVLPHPQTAAFSRSMSDSSAFASRYLLAETTTFLMHCNLI